jgi:hypothetical protein
VRPPERSSPLVWVLGALVALGALLTRRQPRRLPPGVDAADLVAGYERSDMRAGVVIAGFVGLLVVLALVLAAVTSFEAAMTGVAPTIDRPADLVGGLQAEPRPTPPAPALEAESGESLDPYMARENAALSQYRWVDRQNGIAAIPIDRAIDIVAAQGLPARRASNGFRDSGNSSPSSASSGRTQEAYP